MIAQHCYWHGYIFSLLQLQSFTSILVFVRTRMWVYYPCLKVAYLALKQPYDYPSVSHVTLKDIGKFTIAKPQKNTAKLDPLWRHQIETFSALLALCERNRPATGGFPSQRPVTRSFDVFFDQRLNKRLSKQSRRRWFETPSRLIWRHCNDYAQLINCAVWKYWWWGVK